MGSSTWQCNGQHHGQQCTVAQRATQWAAAHSGTTDDITGSSARQRDGQHDGQQHTAAQRVTPRAAAHNGAMGDAMGSSARRCNGRRNGQQRMAAQRAARYTAAHGLHPFLTAPTSSSPLSPLRSERNRISERPSATIPKVFSFSWLLTILLIVFIKLLEF